MFETFSSLLAEQAIQLSEHQKQQCVDFLALLLKWNKAYNLTAIDNPNTAITLHLIDSLSILPFIRGNTILDIGSGGGLPGIPLSIALPDQQFTLLDSNGKKCRFLQQAKMELSLENIDVQHSRVQEYQPTYNVDLITCRAFTALTNLVDWCQHLFHPELRILAMKGTCPEDELQQLTTAGYSVQIHQLPDIQGAERCLIEIQLNNLLTPRN